MPRILFRADANPRLGGGHIMRCLALAGVLRERGCDIAFAAARGSADSAPALARSGFELLDASQPADVPVPAGWDGRADAIFVDLYTSEKADETRMRDRASVIAVIEDLPERLHDCDLLVAALPGGQASSYSGRVPKGCRILAGAGYALLRPEFAQWRPHALEHHLQEREISRVLVSMGLTDVGGCSGAIARIALTALPRARIDVVLGPHASSRPALTALAQAEPRLNVLVDVDNMAQRMSEADLAIGAGGGTSLERCALGLPSIAVILADNQRETTQILQAEGALVAIDALDRVDRELAARIGELSAAARVSMAEKAAAACDGQGAQRVADALLERIADRQERRYSLG